MLFWVNILRRRAHQRQDSLMKILCRRLGIVLGLIVVHVMCMMMFEGMGLGDAIWLTFTTISTTGYGDLSAKTDLGRTATIVLMYIGGVGNFAAAFANFSEYKSNRREMIRHGKWNFAMNKHILLINPPKNGRERYLRNFAHELRSHAEYDCTEALIMSADMTTNCLPDEVKGMNFRFNVGSASREADLRTANADKAAAILVLCADPSAAEADDITASIVRRLRDDLAFRGQIIAEVAHDENRGLLRACGANGVTRATNDYPGIIVKAMAVPGSEVLLEDFFQKDGADIDAVAHDGPDGESWNACAKRLLEVDLTLVGYVAKDGATHRIGSKTIRNASHLIVLKPQAA